jgi:hypothetical protein
MGAMAIGTYGTNAVDWEQRIDLDRRRRVRYWRAFAVRLGRAGRRL